MALVNCLECTKQISEKAPVCPTCGAPQQHQQKQASASTNSNINSSTGGWSWMGFIFNYLYYLGYDRKKGTILMLLYFIFPPLASFIMPFYCGFKARKDLPIGKVPYSISKMLIVFIPATMIYMVFVVMVLSGLSALMPHK